MKMNCAACKNKECQNGTMIKDIDMGFIKEYRDEQNESLFRTAAAVEADGYMKLTRIEELILFAKRCGYKRLGIAFCIGLEHEAHILYKVLKQHFKVSSVCCKMGGINKDGFGLKKIHEEKSEVICNPIGQAEILKQCGTELNIICGLCIGHDILFNKYSAAPVTTFIVKDRVLGHNPVSALYSNYYKERLLPENNK
ncbi:DUF1847 domain-containing protein [candidate division KSB1 bacterium]